MMTPASVDVFLHRECPLCSSNAIVGEVSTDRRAESMAFDEVRPFWSGLFKEKVFFSYARCGGCGLMYCPQYFTPAQLGQLYGDMAPNMDLVPSASLVATQQGYWQAVASRVAAGGDYLEIGPDIGYIVSSASQSGKFGHFWLYEPNEAVHPALTAAAAGQSVTLSTAMGDFTQVPDGSVSLAVMVHVLDHMLDPLATLATIRAKLRPDGMLLIVTHNEKSLLRHIMSVRWPPFCLQHPQIYNPDSTKALAGKAGFGRVKVISSVNHFPLDFLLRQAGYGFGVKLDRLPLPEVSLGLRLGNIQTICQP